MWGQHLILDARSCLMRGVTDPDHIRAFSAALVTAIAMVPYGDPVIEYFGCERPETAGYTLVQLIETSCITAHLPEMSGDLYLDVFSCQPFEVSRVLETVRHYFAPAAIRTILLDRQA